MRNVTLLQLAEKARLSDDLAFAQISLRVRRRLTRYALYLGASAGDAERIVDSALDAAESEMRRGKFVPSKSGARNPVMSWLMGFTRNHVRRFYTDHPRTIPLPDNADELFSTEREADGAVRTNEALKDITRQVLSTLPEEDMRLVYMRLVNMMTHRAIGEELGLTTANARQRFHRLVVSCRQEAERLCREQDIATPPVGAKPKE